DSFTVDIALAAGAPDWATLVDNGDMTATLTLAPTSATAAGDYTVTVEATDTEGLVGSVDVAAEVIEVAAPVGEWWKQFDSTSDESVDTGQFLGEVWFGIDPWFYQSQSESWLYIDRNFVTIGQGAWVYSPVLIPGSDTGIGIIWE